MSDSHTVKSMNHRPLIRFGVTFLANGLGSAAGVISGIIVARALQVKSYGNLSFLTASFGSIMAFVDMGSSMAFFTFLSQKRRGHRFMLLYGGWLAVQAAVMILAIGWILPAQALTRIWPGYERGLILLAFCASFLMGQIWLTISHLGEARRKTMWVQGAELTQSLVHLSFLAIAVIWKIFSIRLILWVWVLEYTLMALILGPRLLKQNLTDDPAEQGDGARAILDRFFAYCKPLALCLNLGFLFVFLDRWLLQRYGGSAQQGFFAIGVQFTMISGLATASVLKIFWKEVAEAQELKDRARMEQLYNMVCRLLYFIAAWCCCLIIPYCSEFLRLTVGSTYTAGWICFAIMLLYPIPNSLGRIQSSFMYASGDTKSFMKLSLLFMVLGLPVSYFLLAPMTGRIPGFGLGANGLAYKMIAFEVLWVNLLGYVIARNNGWVYRFWFQFTVLGSLLVLGLTGKWMGSLILSLFGGLGHPLATILVGGSLYCLISVPLVYRVPQLAGLSRAKRDEALKDVVRYLRACIPGFSEAKLK